VILIIIIIIFIIIISEAEISDTVVNDITGALYRVNGKNNETN